MCQQIHEPQAEGGADRGGAAADAPRGRVGAGRQEEPRDREPVPPPRARGGGDAERAVASSNFLFLEREHVERSLAAEALAQRGGSGSSGRRRGASSDGEAWTGGGR